VVSYTPRPLYLRGNRRRYSLSARLGGRQDRSRRLGEKQNLPLRGKCARTECTVLTDVKIGLTETEWGRGLGGVDWIYLVGFCAEDNDLSCSIKEENI
jgi:hypothetical protein